jgi:lipopolysaccharide/colanic/teichoic acid biosynthesis glycosyltransferase
MREREDMRIRSRKGPATLVGRERGTPEMTFPRDYRHRERSIAVPAYEVPAVEVARPLSGYERFGKPVFDFIVAGFLLVVTAPLFLVLAIIVRLTMGPGVIFRQTRIGKGGRTFTVYKFRTMRPDRRRETDSSATSAWDGVERRLSHKRPDHPLVTPVGGVLRKLSIDELPQLWNVVRGEMSIVGPRPELPGIVARYESWQHRRHEVKPGLTGLWQVTARGTAVMHERTDVDIEYLSRIGFRTDLSLILRTIPVMLLRQGAF